MPYLTADQIQLVFADLPEASVPGRSGGSCSGKVGAAFIAPPLHACAVTVLPPPQNTGPSETPASIRKRLSYVTDAPPKEFKKWVNRYRCMPGYYYDGGPRSDPGTLTDAEGMSALGHIKGTLLCCGRSALAPGS